MLTQGMKRQVDDDRRVSQPVQSHQRKTSAGVDGGDGHCSRLRRGLLRVPAGETRLVHDRWRCPLMLIDPWCVQARRWAVVRRLEEVVVVGSSAVKINDESDAIGLVKLNEFYFDNELRVFSGVLIWWEFCARGNPFGAILLGRSG